MAHALLYGQSATVEHTDRGGVIPAAASVRLLDTGGAAIESPTVTLDSVSTTVSAATSTTTALEVQDATGIVVGRQYAVTSDGETHRVTVERVDGAIVYLTSALPEVPDDGSPFVGLRMSATVSALSLPQSRIGDGYRLEWEYSDAAGDTYRHSVEIAIVRWMWADPVAPDDVRDYVSRAMPGLSESRVFFARVADEANKRIEDEVEASGRRVSHYGDSDAFRSPGFQAMQLALAKHGYPPPGQELADVRRDFHHEMRKVIGGLRKIDADEDGKLDATRPRLFGVRIVT